MAKNSGTVVDLDADDSVGMAGMVGKVVPAQSKRKTGGTRPTFEDTPHCPHCLGRMHMNLPAATVNFECLWRQFNVATGTMTDPSERLPVFTAADIAPLAEYAETRARSRKNPLSYGKMATAGAGPATYAAARTAAKSVSDVAEDVEVAPKKVRAKGKVATAAEPVIPPTPKTATPVEAPKASKPARAKKGFSMADIPLDEEPEQPVAAAAPSKPKLKVVKSKRPAAQGTASAKSGSAPTPNPAPKSGKTATKRAAAFAKATASR